MSPEPKDGAVRPAPRWNVLSVLTPIIGAALFLALRSLHSSPGGYGLALFFIGALISSPFGVIAAFVAGIRNERFGLLTALGFLVNIPLAIIALLLEIGGA